MTCWSCSPPAGLQRHSQCSGLQPCPTRRTSTHLCCQNQFLSCCHLPLTQRLTSLQLFCCLPLNPSLGPILLLEGSVTPTDRYHYLQVILWGPRRIPPGTPHCPAPRVTKRGPHPSNHPGAPHAPSFVRTAWRGRCGPGSFLLRLTTPTQVRPWPRAPAAPEHRRTQTERARSGSESGLCHSEL